MAATSASTPTQKLEVNGGIKSSANMQLYTGGQASVYIGSSSGAGQYGAVEWDDSLKIVRLWNHGSLPAYPIRSQLPIMAMWASGRRPLARGWNVIDDIHASGSVTASRMVCCPSDARLKTDIEPLNTVLDRLLQLRGVTFKWRKPGTGNRRLPDWHDCSGNEQISPNWVVTGPDEYEVVGYPGFEALTIESLRELKAENDHLKIENSTLKIKLASIEDRLSAIEKRVMSMSPREGIGQ